MNLVANAVARLRGVFRRAREDAETREELEFHLEMETEKNLRAGMAPIEARRQARVRLGGVEVIREAVRDARGTRLVEDLLRDLGYAFRVAGRSPSFTAAVVVSLAIPIGFNGAIFTIVDSFLLRPLGVVRPAQLVDVYTSDPNVGRYSTSSYPDYLDLRAENGVFTDMAAHAPMVALTRVDQAARLVMGEAVTGNYFPFLGVRPARGRMLAPDDDRPGAPRVAVISSGLWARAFGGDPGVVGRSLGIGTQSYLVVGVAPPEFLGMPPIPGPDLWIPMTRAEDVTPTGITTSADSPGETLLERRGERWMFVKGRIRDDVSVAQATTSLDAIMADLAAAYPRSNEDRQLSLILTDDARLPPQVAGAARLGAAGLMLVVGVVLLVACANVTGMLLARGTARRREIAVRLAVGASRGRLVRQLLTESLVLSSLGAGAGLGLAWSALRLLAGVEPPIPLPVSFEFTLDTRAFVFTAAVAAGAGVLAGLAPALDATRRNLVRDVNGGVSVARAGGRRWILRDALVAAQLAVTVPLLVLAGLLARGAAGVTADVSLGFDADRVAAVDTDLNVIGYDDRRGDRFLRDALERVRAMPAVEAAALASRAPLDLSSTRRVVLVPGVHGSADQGDSMDAAAVSADYFDTVGVPLLEGRTFTAADTPESPRVAVVSETMARRYWPDGTAVGRRFRLEDWGGVEYEVVGVSADYRVRFPSEEPAPYLHFAASQRARADAVLLARTDGDAAALAADIRRELRRREPDVFFYLQGDTLREKADVTMLPYRVGASVASASGVVAMALGAVGLYGVVAFLVAGRTRELAIRSALGARPAALLGLVLAAGGRVVVLGVGGGAVLALAAARVVAGAPGGVAASDPVVWAGAILLVAGVAAAAHVGPARRVVKIDLKRALQVD